MQAAQSPVPRWWRLAQRLTNPTVPELHSNAVASLHNSSTVEFGTLRAVQDGAGKIGGMATIAFEDLSPGTVINLGEVKID